MALNSLKFEAAGNLCSFFFFIFFSPLESVLILESQGSDHVDPWVLHNTMMIHTTYNIISIPVIGSQEQMKSVVFMESVLYGPTTCTSTNEVCSVYGVCAL
jgi:hypothetical protein